MPRFKRRLTVRYSEDGHLWHPAFTGDVGPGGMFIVSRFVPASERTVRVLVDVPQSGPVELVSQVRWSRGASSQLQAVQRGGFGVQITGAPELWYTFLAQLR